MSPFLTLVMKELRIELRTRELTLGALFLVFLLLLLSDLAWSEPGRGRSLAPGILWITLTFAGTLSLSRSVHRERDRGTWEALALLPVDRGTLFLSKFVLNLAVLLLLEAVAVPLYVGLFDAPLLDHWAGLLPVLVLGAAGLAAAGTLLSAASAHGRAREILLPILLFPFLVPLLMMELQATERVLQGSTLMDVAPELEVLLALDAIFLAIGWLTFDHLLGD